MIRGRAKQDTQKTSTTVHRYDDIQPLGAALVTGIVAEISGVTI